MKKTLITLLALAGVASADYIWQGGSGTITQDDWKNKNNWNITNNSSWVENSNGPLDCDGMYGVKTVINQSLTLSGFNLEGWQPLLQVTNNSTLTATFDKLQCNGASITVDAGSTFNMTVIGDYKDFEGNFYVNGTLNLNLDGDNGIPTTKFTLGDSASLSVSNSTTGDAVTLNANLLGDEAGFIYTRTLLTYNNASFTNVTYEFGEGWTNVGEGEITGAQQYKITNNASGISVSYMAVAPASTPNVPEPTTATLSLLALAGLAARRRRASR